MSEPLLPLAVTPFRVDSDEGREVVLDVVPALLEAEEPFAFAFGGELPTLRLRLTNDEAAALLLLLEAEVGDWMRERDSARRVFERGERSLSLADRSEYGLEVDPDEGLDELDPSRSDYGERLAELGDVAHKARKESR